MTNVFYMCFGIFIFAFGQIFRQLCDTRFDKTPDPCKSKHAELRKEEERFIEVPDVSEDTLHLHEDALEGDLYEHAIQTYPNVKKTPATPPVTDAEGLYDYTPSLHEEVDVEIMTPEREIEIYKRANMLGGV